MIRKLLLSPAFIIALTANAYSTDVTISAMTVPGFSPANIGADRSITVGVTSGSPTVTSSALFPANTVGLGGFRVKIGSTFYTVASVDTTSSLTLTANYASSTGSATMIFYKWVEWRFYANQSFTPLGASYVVQPGAPGSGSWFRRFAASVVTVSGTASLYVPEISIPATTDATDNNTAKWTIGIYRPDGSQIPNFFLCSSNVSQLSIPPTTPTTYQALCAFNSPAVVIPVGTTAYNKAQIDERFPVCSTGQMIYYAATGNKQTCLTVGSGLSISGGTIATSGGVTSLNGLTGAAQTLVTGTSGGDFNISSSGTTHTFNLPTASASHRGALSSSDWSTFNNKLGTIQEEGSGLTQRQTLNFVGSSFTAADDSGNSRTTVTSDSDLDALASNSSNGFWARTGAGTGATRLLAGSGGISLTDGDGVAGNPIISWTPETRTSNVSLWGGASASRTLTFDISGTDPVITVSSGNINVSTGSLQVGGVNVASSAITLTAGPGLSGGGDLTTNRQFDLDLSTLTANQTIFDSAQASRTITFGLSGATDPAITFADNSTTFSNSNVLVQSANGRIWGISGLSAGHTVNFQYGGDAFNQISLTYGAGPIFEAYHGLLVRTATLGGVANAALTATTGQADKQALVAKGASSQTANVLEAQNSSSAVLFAVTPSGMIQLTGILFANLGTPANGTIAYCSDCLKGSNPCSGASTGAIAQRLNGVWRCD